jgi:VWFA-related protein
MTRTLTAVGLTCLALFTSFVPSTPFAQTQSQRPTFRATTNIVQTDVTVLDRNNKPVHGLTIDDFELFEDGERVELLGFAEVNIPDADEAPSWMRESTPDVRRAVNGRVMLFLLDDAQMPYLMTRGTGFVHPNERIAAVKRIAEQFLNRLGPDDLGAVICVYDKRCDQDFTSDRNRLRAAIAKFSPKGVPASVGGASILPTPYKISANMAESIAKLLEGQTSRRRSIVYVSSKLAMRPAVWPPPSDGAGNPGMSMEDIQVLATFQAAMKSGITVYGVNPNSLLSLKDALPDDPDAPESDRVVRFTAPPRSLSAETGGFNISRPGDFAEGVTQIFRETGSYYMLGYEPPEKRDTGYNMVGGLRELEVRVKREGLTVKSHRGYIAIPPPKVPRNPPAESTSALAGVLPKTDLPLRVAVSPFDVPGQAEAAVAIIVGIDEPVSDGLARDYIDLQVRAFTQGGKQVAATRDRVDARLAPNRTGTALTEIVSELRLKPGVYEIRASAFSERMQTSGSVYTDIEIPDYARTPLAMSGVLLMAFPKPESITPNPLAIDLPVVPTTSRQFGHTALVRGFVRVYQGGSQPMVPVTIHTTILDERSQMVVDRSESLAVDRFAATRSTDVRIDVPVPDLSPGIYRLRIEAFALSRQAFRDVVFTVK